MKPIPGHRAYLVAAALAGIAYRLPANTGSISWEGTEYRPEPESDLVYLPAHAASGHTPPPLEMVRAVSREDLAAELAPATAEGDDDGVDHEAEKADLREQVDAAASRAADLERQLAEANQANTSGAGQVAQLNKRIAQLEADAKKPVPPAPSKVENDKLKARVAELEAQLAAKAAPDAKTETKDSGRPTADAAGATIAAGAGATVDAKAIVPTPTK